MPIRRSPGRPKRNDPPAPSKRRVVKVPIDLDDLVVREAAARGLSYQAAAREALLLWLGTEVEKTQPKVE